MHIDIIKSFIDPGCFFVIINGHNGGTLEMKEDGYYDWYPTTVHNGGYIPTVVLKSIYDKLMELNKEWDEQVMRDVG